jgi:sulfur-carrier protein
MDILFFGSLMDIVKVDKLSIDKDIATAQIADTDSLKTMLHNQYPAFQTAKYFIAINQQMIHSNTELKQDDIVALMPPFSGG